MSFASYERKHGRTCLSTTVKNRRGRLRGHGAGRCFRGVGTKRNPIVARFVLARHGVTRANQERRYVSRSDVPLLPEAEAALRPLRRLAAAGRPLAFASDMRRCTSTLARVSPHGSCFAVQDLRLRELDFGLWEGHTYNDLQAEPAYRSWLDNPAAVTPPGGESWHCFEARTAAVWRDILRHAAMAVPRLSSGAGPAWRRRSAAASGKRARSACLHSNCPQSTRQQSARQQSIRQHRARPQSRRLPVVLIVTHGGVVRRLYTLAFPAASFWDAPAPNGGGLVLTAQRRGSAWRFLRAEPILAAASPVSSKQ